MGYSALKTSSQELRALCAYEGRRLAKIIAGYTDTDDVGASAGGAPGKPEPQKKYKYNCGQRLAQLTTNTSPSPWARSGPNSTAGVVDCARLLIDYSPAGDEALLHAQPTARLFKLSAFGWEGRNAIGFFRSASDAVLRCARARRRLTVSRAHTLPHTLPAHRWCWRRSCRRAATPTHRRADALTCWRHEYRRAVVPLYCRTGVLTCWCAGVLMC